MQKAGLKKKTGLPKYLELKGRLLEELSMGKFNSGDKFYSEAQVSQNYKSALMTVRRSYEMLEKDGFLRREHGSGTYVNKIPNQIIRQKVVQICMVGIFLSSKGSFDSLARGTYLEAISRVLKQNGMATMIILDDPAAIPADSLDGLIYLGEGSINEVKAIRKLNLPTVSLGANRVKYFSGICQKKDFIYDVFMKFLLKGRRKIALLNFGGDSHLNEVNLTHLQKAIFDFGAGEYVEITGDSGNLQCKLEECLLRDDRPDAIFLPRWAYLAGVMLTLQKLKLKIGREIGAFVGNCPDFGLSEMPAYVNSAVDLQAEQAANMLARMIKDPDFKGKVIEDEPIISNKEAL